MPKREATGIVLLGATGPVAELCRATVVQPGLRLRPEAIATANHPELEGKLFGETDLIGPPELADVPIIGLEDAVHNTDSPVIVSGLKPSVAAEYEDQFAKDRPVFSNSSANRGKAPVANSLVNPAQIDELHARRNIGGRLVGILCGGNCAAGIIAVATKPIDNEIGVKGIHIRTMQGWSGAGLSEVPEDADEFPLIPGDEWDKVKYEPRLFLSDTADEPASTNVTAEVFRGPWVRGHRASVRAKLKRETSKREIEHIWRSFRAPKIFESVREELRAISLAGGEKWPPRYHHVNPVKLEYGDLMRYDTDPKRLIRVHPMRVSAHLEKIDEGNPQWIEYELVGDNLMMGAVGVNLANVVYARAMGWLG